MTEILTSPTPENQTIPVRALSSAQTVSRIVWALAFLTMGFFTVDGFVSIEIQTGAPQQAAAGAIACFRVIAPYVLARAFHQTLCAR